MKNNSQKFVPMSKKKTRGTSKFVKGFLAAMCVLLTIAFLLRPSSKDENPPATAQTTASTEVAQAAEVEITTSTQVVDVTEQALNKFGLSKSNSVRITAQ